MSSSALAIKRSTLYRVAGYCIFARAVATGRRTLRETSFWELSRPLHTGLARLADFKAESANARPPHLAAKALAAGVLAGSAGSLVGMGGGFLAIPIMTSRWMAFSQHEANATSLMAVLATGCFGGASFALAGSVDWAAAAAIAGGGILTANAGARLASQFPGYVLKGLMGVYMLCVGVGPYVFFKPHLVDEVKDGSKYTVAKGQSEDEAGSNLSVVRVMKLVVIGGAVGLFCGIFGVGGGAVTVPAVSLCLPELSHQDALGTSLAAMVLPALSGIARHAQTGAIVGSAALPLVVGSSLGSFLSGRFVALELDEASLRSIFAATMVVMGGRTLQSSLVARRVALTSAAL